MAESMVLAALAFTHHPPVVALYVTAAVGGTLLALDNPLRRSFVTEMVPAGDRPNAVVLYSLIVNVGRVFGPALAGLLAITVGYGWCFSVDAASYLVVLAALWLMRPAELYRGVAASRAKGQIRAGLRYVVDTPNLWISFGMLAAVGLLSYNFGVTLPLFATRALHGGDSTFTLLYSTFALGAVVSALVIASRNLVQIGHIIMGSIGLGIAMLALAAAPDATVAVPVTFPRGRDQHSLYDLDHGHHPSRSRPGVARSDPVAPDVHSHRHPPDRRTHRRFAGRQSGSSRPLVLGGVVCLAAAVFGGVARRAVLRRGSVGPSTTDESRSTMPLTTMDDMPALVVIDLQKGTVATPTAHPVDEVVQRAARLASAFRRHHLPVVLVNVAGRAPGRTERGRPNLTLAGDWADLVDELQAQPDDHRVTKLRWGAFHGTSLDAHLRDLGVTQIVLAGISTSIGVESTARSAYEHGYHVVLATDAMTDTDSDAHDNSVERIFPRLGETATTSEVLEMLESTR